MDYRQTEVPKLRWIGRTIAQNFPSHDGRLRMADLGCADAPNEFLRGHIIGVDYAVVPCPANYAEMVRWDLNRLPLPIDAESLDAVIMGDIIEHVRRPFELVDEAHRLLRPGGMLLITTPNPHYVHEVLKSWLGLLIPDEAEHLVHFPAANLKQYLERNGFKVEGIRYFKFWVPKLKWFWLRVGVPSALGYQYFMTARRIENAGPRRVG